MTDTKQTKVDHGQENARGWLSSIEEMTTRLALANEQAMEGPDETEAPRRDIEESILSVQVRSGWYSPGRLQDADDEATPEEYEILLSTGGPALRIIGRLDEYCQPTSAELQHQDWGTPWTQYPALEATLLAFAQCFYFGE